MIVHLKTVAALLGVLVFESGVFCQTYVQIAVGPPNASKTFPTSINEQGQIVGYWQGAGFSLHGFVRSADGGTITLFDVPGPLVSTLPQSINDAGAITGTYQGAANPGPLGFVRDPEGNFTSFAPPGSVNTLPLSINAGGAVTGYYYESNRVLHGFVREPNGTITSFDPPGSTSTYAVSINANGAITGSYRDANGTHGFVRWPGGTIVSFDVPGSTGTGASTINNAGAITGNYGAPNGRTLGFVRNAGGEFTLFDPGTATAPTSINDEGAITGFYFDTSSSHGFVRSPGGMITSFDARDVCTNSVSPVSINKAGVILGWCYLAPVGVDQGGFVRYP